MNKFLILTLVVLGTMCSIKATAQSSFYKMQLDQKRDSIEQKTREDYGMRLYNVGTCPCFPMLITVPKPHSTNSANPYQSNPYNFTKPNTRDTLLL
jgi:hypothetical protein